MEITVSGTGRSSLRPERATLHLTAGFESGDKAEAMSEATRVVNELSADLRRLKELDLPDDLVGGAAHRHAVVAAVE